MAFSAQNCFGGDKGREGEGRGAEVEAAPGLLLWGLGRTKGRRGSGDEEGKWGRIQGKPEIFQLLLLKLLIENRNSGSRIKIC